MSNVQGPDGSSGAEEDTAETDADFDLIGYVDRGAKQDDRDIRRS